ncbi:MAG: hypothetical protein A3G34_07070 [Candidatus Lindowbacteria bacterium RIFCSPLOWO2_12_FULL_62_27]|nr:MAG: hypothetical protein A3G34_07070 [Candidatus Lindowbacteria bacterium RIFCSPLOWO2_12_FULL_62_27]OGH61796.1 MAG: hypothetical protein A3I06_09250 [Candidatus Lindowbacteria bacterium RIFCSPLOWO2_02_FULL_62_12]
MSNDDAGIIARILKELIDAKELADHAAQSLYLSDHSYYADAYRNIHFALHDGRTALYKHANVSALGSILKKIDALTAEQGLSKSMEKLADQCRVCNDVLHRLLLGSSVTPVDICDIDPAAQECRRTSRLIAKMIVDGLGTAAGGGKAGQ